MLGNNVTRKLQGNSRLILRKLRINIGLTLNIINFAEVVKKILKTFLEIFMKFVGEMRRSFVQVCKHFNGNFVLFLSQLLKKLKRNCVKNMQLLVSI